MNKKIATVILSSSFLIPTTLYAHQVSQKMQKNYTHEKIVGKDRYETESCQGVYQRLSVFCISGECNPGMCLLKISMIVSD